MAALRDERLRRAAERRGQRRTYDRPEWRTLARGFEEGYDRGAPTLGDVERWRPRDVAVDRNTDAEYEFYRVSGRFQRYAAELLFATERILDFVPWTAPTGEHWWARVARWLRPAGEQAPEGALFVTDREVLLLRDDEATVGGTLFWGYRVHAIPHDRIAAVGLRREPGRGARLRLYLRAGCPARIVGEVAEWLFPTSSGDALDRAAALLRGFGVGAAASLSRPVQIEPMPRLTVTRAPLPGRRRATLEVTIAPEKRAALEAALDESLHSLAVPDGAPRVVRARAFVPCTDRRDSPLLFAVTQSHALVVPLPAEGEPCVHRLTQVTSAEFRHSTLGYHLAWHTGGAAPLSTGGAGVRRTELTFPLAAYPDFFAAFAALRQALAIPPARALGSDLPLAVD